MVSIAFVVIFLRVREYEKYWEQPWIHQFEMRRHFFRGNVITRKNFSLTIPERFCLQEYKSTEICLLQYPNPTNRRSYSYGFHKINLPMEIRTNGVSVSTLPHDVSSDSITFWIEQKVANGYLVNIGAPDTIVIDTCHFIGRKSKICDLKIKKNYYNNDSFGSYFNNEKRIRVDLEPLNPLDAIELHILKIVLIIY